MKLINNRTSEYPIDDLFLKRHSARAMSGESISKNELLTLFEAARWAPSSNNHQPWRFVYAFRDTEYFKLLFSFLNESNQVWCNKGSALIVVLSSKFTAKGNISLTHSFDTGLAVENLLLQAIILGLTARPMGGINRELIREKLQLFDEYAVECMIVIGKPGNINDLPETLQEKEKPSQRRVLEETIFEGNLNSSS